MTNDEKVTFFQCLFAIAWTDGEIGEQENAILATLFNNVSLADDQRDVVSRWFDTEPPEPDWSIPAADAAMRESLVSQVFLIAASDGVVNAAEIAMLDRLRDRLGMPNDEFQSIAVEVEKMLANSRS